MGAKFYFQPLSNFSQSHPGTQDPMASTKKKKKKIKFLVVVLLNIPKA
jgi:hypothetical protein